MYKLNNISISSNSKENSAMKTLTKILSLGVFLIFTGCSSTYQIASYDDVYYTPKKSDNQEVTKTNKSDYQSNGYEQPQILESTPETKGNNNRTNNYSSDDTGDYPYTETTQNKDKSGDTYVNNNYFEYDDYYDYSYSSRLRRFYSPSYYNWGYYDPWYTNAYWYNYNPFYWGVSIYLGYSWCSYQHYHGWGYNYPYYGWYGYHTPYYHYYGWGGYPYYYGGYYSSYWHGYNHGYWDGYHDGYYGETYYYNSLDKNTHSYGPRGGIGSSGTRTPGSTGNTRETFAQRYESSIYGRTAKSVGSSSKDINATSSVNEAVKNERGNSNVISNESNSSRNNETKISTTPATDIGRNSDVKMRSENTQTTKSLYERPNNTTTDNRTNPIERSSQTSPVNTKPESQGQSRSTQNAPPSENQYNYRQELPKKQYAKPDNYEKPVYTRPNNEPTPNTKSYSSPTYGEPRSSDRYTAPRPQPNQSVNRPNQSRPNSEEGSKQYSQPKSYTPSTTPRQESPSRNYTAPKSNESYQSSPSKSNSSSSSSSGSSYSAPSRSSSSGSSSSGSSRSSSSSSDNTRSSGGRR